MNKNIYKQFENFTVQDLVTLHIVRLDKQYNNLVEKTKQKAAKTEEIGKTRISF